MRLSISVVLLFLLFLCGCRPQPHDPSDPEVEQDQFIVAPGYPGLCKRSESE